MIEEDSQQKCPFCGGEYDDPKLLPCLHSCCLRCLKRISSFQSSFRCPVCQEEVPRGLMSSFPDNFWLRRQKTLLEIEKAIADGNPLCTSCNVKTDVKSHCQECDDLLCEICTMAHKKMKATKMHHLEEILMNKDDENGNEMKIDLRKRALKCSLHPVEVLRYYCVTCEEVLCSECLVINHKRHELAKVEDISDGQRTQLAIVEMKTKSKLAPILQCMQNVLHLSHNAETNAKNAKAGVQDQITKCKKMLDTIEDKLLREIDAEACKKSAVLEGQAKVLDAVIERFQTACSVANKTVQYANDVEMMLARKVIAERLVKLGQTEVDTEPKSDDILRYDALMEEFEKCLDGGFLGKVIT